MFNILGVPAQAHHATNQVMFVAVVLSAVSFLFFFVTLSAVEGLFDENKKGCRCHHSRKRRFTIEDF
jgi:hypothetical protein